MYIYYIYIYILYSGVENKRVFCWVRYATITLNLNIIGFGKLGVIIGSILIFLCRNYSILYLEVVAIAFESEQYVFLNPETSLKLYQISFFLSSVRIFKAKLGLNMD